MQRLHDEWVRHWPEALQIWSPFVTLRQPVFCRTPTEATEHRMGDGLAMIRLSDQTILINLPEIERRGLAEFPLEILAHEIGHHVLAPADLSQNAQTLARVRMALPMVEHAAPMVANLWTDLLINDRLQRQRGLDMAAVFIALGEGSDSDGNALWNLYQRTYEILWSLVRGSLARGTVTDVTEGDALLASRVVRTFARRMVRGGGSFAALCLPYLLDDGDEDGDRLAGLRVWADALSAGAGGFPDGLTEIDSDDVILHPLYDPEISGTDAAVAGAQDGADDGPSDVAGRRGEGQSREPFEYGQLLRATGLDISDRDAAIRYYRERAVPHLVPFPVQEKPSSTDPLPEGLDIWDIGEPVNDIDWTESLIRSPLVVPGVTTVQRVWGTTEGADPGEIPVDLDLYIDSSGSMPNPQVHLSYPALAGAIVALSALRAGASVQATLWSGAQQFTITDGFVTDEQAILAVLTGHFGGGTAFPLHVLRESYSQRSAAANPAHILIVSDSGIDTMFNNDEHGTDGRTISQGALAEAGGGGTMVLQLFRDPAESSALVSAAEDGWDIHPIRGWDDLVAFARAFSRRTYDHQPPERTHDT